MALVPLLTLIAAAPARAAVIALTPADFAGATLIDFGAVQTLAPIDGQVISGVTFGFTIQGNPSPLAVIDGGPGNTNNITIANIANISGSNADRSLILRFPSLQARMGFGFAVLAGVPLPDAAFVSLFDANDVFIGSISADANLDPIFPGGFLGLGSDIPFLTARVSFTEAAASFAFDNLRFSSTPPAAVPEPATLALVGLGALGLMRRVRRTNRTP